MLRAFKILAMLVAGITLGLAASWATAIRGTLDGSVTDGPWHTSLDTGSSEGGPCTLINDERRLAEIEAARRHGDCTPYKAG